MSDQIRPSEISEVLLAQLKDIDTDPRFEEVGTVLQVSDGVVRIYGLKNAEAGELLELGDGIKAVVMNLEEDNVGAVLLGPTDKIKEGMTIRRTRRIASLNVGESMLGRVVNPLFLGYRHIFGPAPQPGARTRPADHPGLRQRRCARPGPLRGHPQRNDSVYPAGYLRSPWHLRRSGATSH